MAEVCVPSRRGRRGCRALPLPRLPPVGGAGQGCRASGVGPRASIRVKKPGTPSPGVLPKRGCQSVIQEQAADTSWSLQVNGFLSAPGGSRGPRDALPPHPRSASRGGRTACLPHGVRGRHSGLGDADLASLVLGTRMWVGASAPSEPAGTRPRAGAARVVSVRKCPACPAAAAPHPSPSLPDSRSRNASLTASGRLRAESPLGCPRRPCPPACRCVGTAGARPGATGLVAPRASRHQSGSRRVWWGEGRGLEG